MVFKIATLVTLLLGGAWALEPHEDLTPGSDASWSVNSGNSCYVSEPDFPHLEKEDSNPRHRINGRLSRDGKDSANSGCGYIWPDCFSC